MKYEVHFNEADWPVELNTDNNSAAIDGATIEYSFESAGEDRWILRTGAKTFILRNVTRQGTGLEFTLNGQRVRANVKDEKDLLIDKLGFKVGMSGSGGKLNAPMPGKILKLLKNTGDEVKLGDPVIILEAMKMENELKSPVDGIIKKIHTSEGDSVEKNSLLLEIETIG